MEDEGPYQFNKGEVIKKTTDDSKTLFFALNDDGLGVVVKEVRYGSDKNRFCSD